jgi:hypothetical protein
MSRKNKALRSFLYQHPNASVQEAWDAAWANQQGCFASRKHEEQQAEITRLQAIIDAAPHDSSCWKGMSRGKHGARQWECNCWKAETKKASEDA